MWAATLAPSSLGVVANWREFVYWSVPAVLLILYALAVAVPGLRGGVMLLGAAIAMQNCVVAWVDRKSGAGINASRSSSTRRSSQHDPVSGAGGRLGLGRAPGRMRDCSPFVLTPAL